MLENLSERLQGIFSGLRSKGRLKIGRASCRERV